MKKNAAPLVVIVALIASLYALLVWLPGEVAQQNLLLAQKTERPVSGTALASLAGDEPPLPQELIDYIATKREISNSTSDHLDEEDLIESFEKFQEDYALRAEDVFNRRFDRPDGEDKATPMSFDAADFEVPPGLYDIVQFWIHIFGVYDKNVVVFHHADNVGVVYSVLDFSALAGSNGEMGAGTRAQLIRDERERLEKMLSRLSAKLAGPRINWEDLSVEERRVVSYLEKEPELDPAALADNDNIKLTAGFAHRFRKAIATSGMVMPEMLRIFRQYGLPPQLTCIPFVESAFSETAYSSAGAAGIWQFIRDTGKRYLRIDDYVDERYDTILATHAAAKHLAAEYKLLKSWPMTINAYNTGPGRLMDAQRVLGTRDITTIVKQYKGSGYGYDSRNYFPEVLAAIEVYRNHKKYFGDIQLLPQQPHDYLVMPANTNLKHLFRQAGVSAEVMKRINLAIKPEVMSGEVSLPKGYYLKVMSGAKEDLLLAAHEMYLDARYASYHLVEKGEDLV
jgi:membrane-bound lytic murein transglycosylase D